MTSAHTRRGAFVLFVLWAGLAVACGKKGPPLAPLPRIPAAPANPQAVRFGDDIYVSFTVPSANVSGQTPADITAVDLYAITAEAPPSGPDLTRLAERIASYPVHVPPPALPDVEPEPGVPAPPPLPVLPGFAQGATAVVRETLTDELRQPAPPVADSRPVPVVDEEEAEPLPGPLVAPSAPALRRHYFLMSVGRRGRPGTPTGIMSVPVGGGTTPPLAVEVDYTETAMSVSWKPSADARPVPPEPDETLLPSRPLMTPPPPTAYHVFEVPRASQREPGLYDLVLPQALTPQPVTTPAFQIPGSVRFGAERCFVVRSVEQMAGATLVGHPSAPACVTPVDTFPPAAPRQLAAIAGVGVINLIWEGNTESDLAGYVLLRGSAPDGPLQPLTPTPIRETTYRDTTAEPGVRYVYAVVAVDTASPQNVSEQSNRVEEESRTP